MWFSRNSLKPDLPAKNKVGLCATPAGVEVKLTIVESGLGVTA
jgi:hypothetical protein